MGQIKNGTVVVFNGSPYVFSGVGALWTSPTPTIGSWFTVYRSGVTYQVAAVETLDPADYAGGTANKGDTYRDPATNLMYVAIQAVPSNTSPPNTTYWQQITGHRLTLSANYAAVDNIEASYAVAWEFTNNLSLPLISPGDVDAASILSRALNLLDDHVYASGDRSFILREDFEKAASSGLVLPAGWGYSPTDATAPTLAFVEGVANHPGIVSVTNGSAHTGSILMISGGVPLPFKLSSSSVWEFVCVFKASATTNTQIKVGLGENSTLSGDYRTLIFFHPSVAQLRYYSIAGAGTGQEVISSMLFAADTWYKGRIFGLGDGKVRFQINDGPITIMTIFPQVDMYVGFNVFDLSSSSPKTLSVDYVHFKLNGLIRY